MAASQRTAPTHVDPIKTALIVNDVPLTFCPYTAPNRGLYRHHLDSTYVADHWLPRLGPGVMAVLQVVHRRPLEVWHYADLARLVGLGLRSSHLIKLLHRGRSFRVLRFLPAGGSLALHAHVMLPSLVDAAELLPPIPEVTGRMTT